MIVHDIKRLLPAKFGLYLYHSQPEGPVCRGTLHAYLVAAIIDITEVIHGEIKNIHAVGARIEVMNAM
jgi:hypothetical protein